MWRRRPLGRRRETRVGHRGPATALRPFWGLQMLEPDVTITDYILAVQSACFAVVIYRKPSPPWWLLFYSTLSVASLAGGTVHGFCPDEASLLCIILWKMTLIALGAMVFAAWHVGAAFLQDKETMRWIKIGAAVQLCLFVTVILFYSQQFLFAAINYLPAAIFLLIIFIRLYFKTKVTALLLGGTSIVLTFLGSFIQIAGISLHSHYFNHNALYHAVQFVALCILFYTTLWDITKEERDETGKYYSAGFPRIHG